MYQRLLEQDLVRLSEQWSVISVTGPRQSGKTTICKMAFPHYDYINLEDPSARELVENDPKHYLLSHSKGLIIDEAQYVPELFSYIQVVVDENPHLRYVLSGSSDFLLMQNITQSLAGRVVVRRLLPLSIRELGNIDHLSTDDLMFRGFYPAIWGDNKSPLAVYDSYLSTYLERDVRNIQNVSNLRTFRNFITCCAARTGNEFSALSISNELGINYKTVQKWITILEASYTAFLFPPYFRNIGKRLTKTPKIYFYDVGLLCYLLGIQNSQQLNTHPLRGAIFENMVVVEMLKGCFNRGERSNLFFYRDKTREIDIIQENGQQLRAYEIKSSRRWEASFFRNMDALRVLLKNDLISTQVIFDGDQEVEDDFKGYINFRNI
ncbi:MAG: ATP-binding protein [Paludibacteraceae bacterium]|nr:ATP-binding protein [Paludibacteraceae bacterium]